MTPVIAQLVKKQYLCKCLWKLACWHVHDKGVINQFCWQKLVSGD